MRAYIRHPAGFPIELCATSGCEDGQRETLRDVAAGGLSCTSHVPFAAGQPIVVRIPVGSPGFEAQGRVAWCHPAEGQYNVGIAFADEALAFGARMAQQVCHIERYHQELLKQGHSISKEEAALAWIAEHAADFPR